MEILNFLVSFVCWLAVFMYIDLSRTQVTISKFFVWRRLYLRYHNWWTPFMIIYRRHTDRESDDYHLLLKQYGDQHTKPANRWFYVK